MISRFLCAAAACATAASLFAESDRPASSNELAQADVPELVLARQALRDGIWQLARQHAVRAGGTRAQLIVLESYASENRWDDVRAELKKVEHPESDPAFGYYVAVTDGKIDDAINCLRKGGSEAGLAEAKMLEAELQNKNGNAARARELWTEVLSLTNASERAFALASVNLQDVAAMRRAYERTVSLPLKRTVGLRLGRALLESQDSRKEGVKLIRSLVQDNPDAEGACEAFLAVAASQLSNECWKEAEKTICEAIEIWPDAVRRADVHIYRGEAFLHLDRCEEARLAFVRAEELSTDDASRARAIRKQGDALAELGRPDDSLERYRTVLRKHPNCEAAPALKRIVRLRELEDEGRSSFKAYRFLDAMHSFAEIALEDSAQAPRMGYYRALCLYGLGRDDEAVAQAQKLASAPSDIQPQALLWLAKFTYNRGEWREAVVRFSDFVRLCPDDAFAPEAMLWSARAAYSANDLPGAIQTVTKLVEKYPTSPVVAAALIVQAEVLIEQARFDEALLVLDRAATGEKTTRAERLKAKRLKADALFAMGADNPARYQASLSAYRAVVDDESLEPGERLDVAFKIGRVLEKLKRQDEATEQYYAQVVLAYRNGRARGVSFGSAGEAAFVRAALRLADDFESRGRDYQAVGVLRLVAESNVPASDEAKRRIARILQKGRFL